MGAQVREVACFRNHAALAWMGWLACAGLAGGVGEAPGEDAFSRPGIAEIVRLHDAAIGGDKAGVLAAEQAARAFLAAHPGDHLAEAYLGSLLTIKASKAFPGPSKLGYLKDGLRALDAAVAAAPDDAAVRFVRAMNNYSLPAFVRRRDNAREDFKALLGQVGDPAQRARLSDRIVQAICYYAGVALRAEKEREEALDAWRQGIALGSETEMGQKIAKELEREKKQGRGG